MHFSALECFFLVIFLTKRIDNCSAAVRRFIRRPGIYAGQHSDDRPHNQRDFRVAEIILRQPTDQETNNAQEAAESKDTKKGCFLWEALMRTPPEFED